MTKIRKNSVKFVDNGSFVEKLSYHVSSTIGCLFYKYVNDIDFRQVCSVKKQNN